ncbi:hypothetical protein M409DRAFT_25554 [Zasmidium cellare ATCC 36951]|uniref:Uncharacterized protein n=1 Tax=Zasmidium cellare ATCC 36951 TaxID=1080233 RepID=A0A6A6CE62_ZASCE|nr:uncharacterized protein M409DRAFT_25554 [Zasmidium cellare ATCC 36951]KAF2164212.1 hypothetical protein M409DRAFT_25554 [Zasmidium cellare ATCC 36951]
MDIHDWLQTTADRQPPDDDQHPGFPAFLKPTRPPGPKQREHSHARKRTSSEPPPSEQHHRRRKRHKAATWSSSSPDHARHLQPAAASSRSSSHASQDRHVRESSGKEIPSKSFERRARHKTKPDRYETKPKQRDHGRKARDDRKSKSKHRRSHQSADVAKATGLIQSFQLKNGRKDKRLTLRPDANAGIFKHGRSSAPVATNGQGLPDLVFNEMKFLQRPQEHQDEVHLDGAAQTQSKKSKQRLREEEISAYFVKKPTPEGALSRRPDARPSTKAANQAVHRSRGRQQLPSSDIGLRHNRADVDLPEKPFLGFGSKGPSHESNTHHPTSYLTWSESAVPLHERIPVAEHRENERIRTIKEGTRRFSQRVPSVGQEGRRVNQLRTTHVESDEPGGEWVGTNRVKGQGHIEGYAPPSNIARPRTKRTPDQSTSSSSSDPLPAPHANLDDDDYSSKLGGHKALRDFRTSDVLRIRAEGRTDERSPSLQQQSPNNPQDRSETPTSDVLRRALHAVSNDTCDQQREQDRLKTTTQRNRQGEDQQGHINILDSGYRPASHARRSNAASTSDYAVVPRRGFSRTAEQHKPLERRPLQPLPASAMNADPIWRPTSKATLTINQTHSIGQDEMPGHVHDGSNLPPIDHYTYTDERRVEELDQHMPSEQEQFYIDPAARQPIASFGGIGADRGSQGSPEGLSNALYGGAFTNPSTDRFSEFLQSGREDEVEEPDDGMKGFWKPNVLY